MCGYFNSITVLFDFQGVFHSVCQCTDLRQTSVSSSQNFVFIRCPSYSNCFFFSVSFFYASSIPDATMQVSRIHFFNMENRLFCWLYHNNCLLDKTSSTST